MDVYKVGGVMHIVLGLVFVIMGFAIGENFSWLAGLALIIFGLLFFDFGGSRFANVRFDHENILSIIGILSMLAVIIGSVFSW